MPPALKITPGTRFGRFTAVRRVQGGRGQKWLSRCETCGTEKEHLITHVIRSANRRCQCLSRENIGRAVERGGKVCPKCQIHKASSDYYRNGKARDGFHCYCRACMRAQTIKRTYGLSERDFSEMISSQGGMCANVGCRRVLNITDSKGAAQAHVDHSHKSGRVRGLLCRKCNSALGFSEESKDRLMGLVEYISNHAA